MSNRSRLPEHTHLSSHCDPARLLLIVAKTDPPATSDADAIVFSNIRAERATGQPQFHGLPEATDPGF